MTTRAIRNLTVFAGTHLDLPSQDHPQLVTNDGHEVDEDTFFRPVSDNPTQLIGEDGTTQDVPMIEDTQVEQEAQDDITSLLTAADSLVLSYSLTQSRLHHINHLLPHIFSHPLIPSHSRPRARPPPKSTFLFPTPPPLVQPLPNPEYHGPSSGPSTPAPDGDDTPKVKGKNKRDRETEAPAHEIECIARVTLSIGPISYPDTELWVGRFVQPQTVIKKVRAKPDKEKRDSIGGEGSKRSKVIQKSSTISTTPLTTATQVARPSPIQNQNQTPTQPEKRSIPQTLIQRVNVAASNRPWLSVIIHKAARQQASKEELATLGRVVARLKLGQDIEDEISGQIPVPATTAKGSTSQSTNATKTLPPSHAGGSSPVDSGRKPPSAVDNTLEEDDSDVDMTGPPQVGGGPIPPSPSPAATTNPSQTKTNQTKSPQSSKLQEASLSQSTPLSRPPAAPTHLSHSQQSSNIPHYPPGSVPITSTRPTTTPTISSPLATTHPAKPTYSQPPPFMLIAFRELPTEKYLLPIGLNSYISRVGGDHVTSHPPVSTQPDPTLSRPPPSGIEGTSNTPEPSSIEAPTVSGRTRARQSIGKPPKTVTPPAKEPTPIPEPSKSESCKSNLPALPGMSPSPGTVLLSTFLPAEWVTPDWEKLGKRLPFNNPHLTYLPSAVQSVKQEVLETPREAEIEGGVDGNASKSPKTSKVSRPLRHPQEMFSQEPARESTKPTILNLGAEDFLPPNGPLQAVTIRLSQVDDKTWFKMKEIMEIVEEQELRAMLINEPEIIPSPSSLTLSSSHISNDVTQSLSMPSAHPPSVSSNPFTEENLTKLRSIYHQRRKVHFTNLVHRVPLRKFLRTRLSSPPPSVVEATTDKFAQRPYTLTTKPLHSNSPPPEDYTLGLPVSPEMKTKKKGQESNITFEMPVSLDYLDERVEHGADGLLKKGWKKGQKVEDDGRKGWHADGRKKHGRRWVEGKVCEGCAGVGLRVWRTGPGGKGTLCNKCGIKYLAGTLGELKAPGEATEGDDERGSTTSEPPNTGLTNDVDMTPAKAVSGDGPTGDSVPDVDTSTVGATGKGKSEVQVEQVTKVELFQLTDVNSTKDMVAPTTGMTNGETAPLVPMTVPEVEGVLAEE
ncbi:hypothetical protein M231_02400 [Tremella mesenterica]|uniref:GATA-type domain-containing protein n=1 Tax=Tremella mesenterica TaxID=5217 RepID=A0A4Q1BQR7_TREME|nr:hypothetical protein M231_02400 [Tremella mesenterica]